MTTSVSALILVHCGVVTGENSGLLCCIYLFRKIRADGGQVHAKIISLFNMFTTVHLLCFFVYETKVHLSLHSSPVHSLQNNL